MRFALVGPAHPYRGGISHYNSLLAERLALASHEVLLVNFARQYPRFLFPGRTQEDESEDAIRAESERLLDPLSPASWRRAADRIASFEPGLALFQWWHPFFGPAYASVANRLLKRSGVRSAFICHNVRPHERSLVDRFVTRRAFRSSSGFLIHAESDRAALEALRPGAPVAVNPHPTYDVFRRGEAVDRATARARLGLGPEKTVLFFGNVRPYKGVPHLVDAMALVRRRIDCRLLLVGEFYFDKAAILRRIEEKGLSPHVTVVDRYVPNEDVKLWFGACDAVCLPYVSATQSGIAQIAFAFERPVIATDAGGLPEAVAHERTGLVCRAGDPRSLAAAIVRYFEERLEAPFVRSIRRESARFSWERLVAAVEGLSLDLGARGGDPSGRELAEPVG